MSEYKFYFDNSIWTVKSAKKWLESVGYDENRLKVSILRDSIVFTVLNCMIKYSQVAERYLGGGVRVLYII